MPLDLDTLLIDRLFQPAADRLAGQTSCFGLARLCLAAAVLLQFVVLATDLQVDDDAFRRMLGGGITILALVGADQARSLIARAERTSRPGLLNVRRITMRWQRVAWLLVTVWAFAVALGQPGSANVALGFASLAWLSCIYFTSCSPSPPVVRSARGTLAFAR